MFKNIFVYIFVLMFSVCPLFSWQGGSGTEADPYQIWTKADLEALADSVRNDGNDEFTREWSRNKHFKLMADITDSITTSIGTTGNYFQGHFDGNRRTITVAVKNLSLFGHVDAYATIENLNVDGKIIVNGHANIGGIVGANGGIVQNCNNYASIEQAVEQIGGIAATNRGSKGIITDCNNYGSIKNDVLYAGGIVGHNSEAKISRCMNAGNVIGGIVGGIAGDFFGSSEYDCTIEYCINTGTITYATDPYYVRAIGGICGYVVASHHPGNTTLHANINHGFVSGDDGIGGICGLIIGHKNENDKVFISSCVNTGVISGNKTRIGCIVGGYRDANLENSNIAVITNCYFDKQMCPYGGIGGK